MSELDVIAEYIEETSYYPMVLAEAQHRAEQIVAALGKSGYFIVGPKPITFTTADKQWYCEVWNQAHIECHHIDEMRPEPEQGP